MEGLTNESRCSAVTGRKRRCFRPSGHGPGGGFCHIHARHFGYKVCECSGYLFETGSEWTEGEMECRECNRRFAPIPGLGFQELIVGKRFPDKEET